MKLRPHHLLCIRFFSMEPPGRGGDFDDLCRRIRGMMSSGDGTPVEVAEGIDDLCACCPHLGNGRCESPFGDEDKVRKWDARVIEGLGLRCGETRSAADLKGLIDGKAPLRFCRERCPWRTVCDVFGPGREKGHQV
ncbi:MAG: DUF1284 domain-containing protein [Desulfobacterota bacterium]|nr:DUF1284 domain-containing protein [Thermodesulfobacteriota bacterium]